MYRRMSAQTNLVITEIPATETHLAKNRVRQQYDKVCRQVMRYYTTDWSNHRSLYSSECGQVSLEDPVFDVMAWA